MSFKNPLQSLVCLEMISAVPEESLSEVNQWNVGLYGIETVDPLTVRFWVKRSELNKVLEYAKRHDDNIKIIKENGIYQKLKQWMNRPVMATGLAVLLFLTVFLPTRVLFLKVEGNTNISDKLILEQARNCGIQFGASRREVRSEKAKNALLSAIPELQWIGVNTAGCVAVISVREKWDSNHMDQTKSGISGIVALRDGIITSCVVTKGTGLVSPGQAVRKGQLMVSGYTDCGLFLQAVNAEAEIFAQTNRGIELIQVKNCLENKSIKGSIKQFSLLVGKKRINLYKDSGIWDVTCDRMYKEYYITLPGGFSFPFGISVDEWTYYSASDNDGWMVVPSYELSDYAEDYLIQQMNAGVILKKEERTSKEAALQIFQGNYLCTEMIGRVEQQKIGDGYG